MSTDINTVAGGDIANIVTRTADLESVGLRTPQTVGLSGVPDAGTAPADNTYVFAQPVSRLSRVPSIRIYAAATGTLAIRRFAKSGDDFTQVGDDVDITISATGEQTLASGADYSAFTVEAGEYLGFYSVGVIARVAATGAAFYRGSGDVTAFSDSGSQDNISMQIGFDLVAYETDRLQAEIDAAEARITPIESFEGQRSGVRVIGRDGAMTAGSVSGSNSTIAFAQPVHFKGTVTKIDVQVEATGTLSVKVFKRDGETMTQIGTDVTITVSETGLQTFVAGTDFTAFAVEPGQYLGFFNSGVMAFVSSPATHDEAFWLGGTGNVSTFVDGDASTAQQWQIGFTVTPRLPPPSTDAQGAVSGKSTYAAYTPVGGVIQAHLGYGQSWMERNGDNGADAAMLEALHPMRAITNFTPTDSELFPAYETNTAVQTIMGPMGLRMAQDAEQAGRQATIYALQLGTGGRTLEQLAASDMPFYVTDSATPYAYFLDAVTNAVSLADAIGCRFEVATLTWCQGAANGGTAYATYKSRLADLFDRLNADIKAATSQRKNVTFLILQPPGQDWQNLQAQVDLANERADTVLAVAGWSLPQHDSIHFSTAGAIMGGEILAAAANAVAMGQPWSAPYIRDVTRSGTTITGYFGGGHAVRVDETVNTARHYVSGSPVANFGFEYSGANITAVSVTPIGFTITLDAAAAGTLGYAWSGATRPDGGSANRGALRADWIGQPVYTTEPLRLWVASGYWVL